MKTLKYCVMTTVYKKKFFHAFMFLWVIGICILVGQFLEARNIAEAGSLSMNYFLVANENFYVSLLIYLTPLLGAYLYGDIYLEEREFLPIVLMRTSRWKLNLCNMLLAFFSAFILMLLFLLFVFITTAIVLHSDSTMLYKGHYLWNPSLIELTTLRVPLSSLYFNNPLLRIFIYIFLFSFYAGLGGLLTYTVSLVMKNKLVVYISTFVCFILMQFITSLFHSDIYIQNVLNPFPSVTVNANTATYACLIPAIYSILSAIACIIINKLEDSVWN